MRFIWILLESNFGFAVFLSSFGGNLFFPRPHAFLELPPPLPAQPRPSPRGLPLISQISHLTVPWAPFRPLLLGQLLLARHRVAL